MGATVREIVNDALTVVGEVSGAGVQAYSEDRMRADAVRAFNLLFKKYYWEQFLQWFTVSLDGTTGKITSDAFTNVRDFEDIYAVHKVGSPRPLPGLPKKVNPSIITGTTPQYWTSLPVTDGAYALRRILIYPKVATGDLDVLARVYPLTNDKTWDWTDRMELDQDMLVNGVAYMTLSGDDLNSGAADSQRALMESRFTDIKAALGNRPIPAGSVNGGVPDRWFTS